MPTINTISVIGSVPMPLIGNTAVPSVLPGPRPKPGIAVVSLDSIQVAGLLPFLLCDSKDCREMCEDEYKNPVFGELVGKTFQSAKSYENDWNHFRVNTSLYNANPSATAVEFYLEKLGPNGQWIRKATLNSNAYGLYHILGGDSNHPSYASYEVNWGAVVFYFGAGCYKVKATVTVQTSLVTTTLTGGTQANASFVLPTVPCLAGKLQGLLNTYSGNIPASYPLNQTDASFTQAQNIQYVVDLINNGSYPYSATFIDANNFYITGESYALNNGILFALNVTTPGCDVTYTATMHDGVNPAQTTVPVTFDRCYSSPVFDLKPWDCMRAGGTVKFETELSGIIGDPYADYKKHDLCNVNSYDSIRVKGFFGKEKSPQYITENLEWGDPKEGLIEKVTDKQIQRFEYDSKMLPEYIHSRFATFGMMADKLFVSDYNLNNTSFALKRRHMIPDSGYEPEDYSKEAHWKKRAKSTVKVFFKRGVQSVSKTNCCPTPLPSSRP